MGSHRFGAALCAALAGGVWAADQVWLDAGVSEAWNLADLNWDGGAAWVNGNSAVFSGAGGSLPGETVEVDAAITVSGLAFQTNGYVIADADGNGSLAVSGSPSVVNVVNAGDTGTVRAVIGGTGGITKSGVGVLLLSTNNTYAGVTTVAQGILRLGPRCPDSLGATGSGSGTVVAEGATLDINGAFVNDVNRAESLQLSGSGVNGIGALVNMGAGYANSGLSGGLTLLGDTVIGCYSRIDFRANVAGNGHMLTKIGNSELAVGVQVLNSPIVINAGNYTYMNALALGSSDFDTTLNGGALRSYGDLTCNEHLICNGGGIVASGSRTNTFLIAGRVTLNGNTSVWGENNNMTVVLAGPLDGAGGLTRSGSGTVVITGNSNTYSGATLITSTLYLGRTNVAAGAFGSGPVTNTSNLYIDRSGSFVSSNGFFGSGNYAIRYGGEMVVSDSVSSNSTFRVAAGTLTLTNNARFVVYGRFYLAERTSGVGYPVDPTNVTATLNLRDGAWLETLSVETGNGNSVAGGGMTGTVNQTGGTLRTTGWSGDPGNFPGEYDGLRIAHYPQAYGVYNLSGGTLRIDNGYRLAIATDGTGWLRQTGGELFANEVVVNARDWAGGYGRLTVAGGTLNVGSNGVTAGIGSSYLVEYGGAGGVVRAQTNFTSKLPATLFGSNEQAITFDTAGWAVALSGNLTGAGGLNKAGTGTLTLSGTNTYAGPTCVLQGRLVRTAPTALPAGGQVLFGVAADGTGGQLYAEGDLSLEGVLVGVANPESLDKTRHYTVASWGGALTQGFDGSVLPGPWFVYYDWANKRAELRAQIGTVLRLK